MTEAKKEIMSFEQISKIDVTSHIEKKMNLSYLSWAWAWQEMKKIDEDAEMIVHEFEEYLLIGDVVKTIKKPYMNDKGGAWVQVSVNLNGRTETELLPVMDNKNRAMVNPDAMSINKNIKRCFVKALALHGLGIHIYAGEDTADIEPPKTEKKEKTKYDNEGKFANKKSEPSNKNLTLEEAKNTVLTFGKHKDKTILELGEKEGSYMRWLLDNSKDETIKQAVKLVGKYLKEKKETDTHDQTKQDPSNVPEEPAEDPNKLLDGAIDYNDEDLPF